MNRPNPNLRRCSGAMRAMPLLLLLSIYTSACSTSTSPGSTAVSPTKTTQPNTKSGTTSKKPIDAELFHYQKDSNFLRDILISVANRLIEGPTPRPIADPFQTLKGDLQFKQNVRSWKVKSAPSQIGDTCRIFAANYGYDYFQCDFSDRSDDEKNILFKDIAEAMSTLTSFYHDTRRSNTFTETYSHITLPIRVTATPGIVRIDIF